MGDDIPDYTAMLEAGVKCAPADACPEIKKLLLILHPQKAAKVVCAR